MLKEKMQQVFANDEMAEELYEQYPATFRLGDRGHALLRGPAETRTHANI